jgi:hypothetical protein
VAAIRRTVRAHAWIAIVAFLCGWMLPFAEAHPLGQDDTACFTGPIAPGPAVPQVIKKSATDQGQPTHCVICHLMRAMNGAVPSDVAALSAPFLTLARHALLDDSALIVASASPSSRGPPAAL